ncbi:hypothetical protein HK098_005642 [Nowakowskiella sp. JEL0407]|nr:hypothetical protein HK098_005642 [Nowakowskiella sp. JEL0407]
MESETTSPEHHHFGSIEQYRPVIKQLYGEFKYTPELMPKKFNLRGTVKLHGTHADIICQYNSETETWTQYYQSRNRILSLEKDNCGYVAFMNAIPSTSCIKLYEMIKETYNKHGVERFGPLETIMIAGEFCGENIQKSVALMKLKKMFVIFAIRVNDAWQDFRDYYHIAMEENDIYNISRGGTFHLVLDMTDTEKIVDELQAITNEVERECPFAKTFGVSGIGEGVVWTVEELSGSTRHQFKVKGDEHANSKVKTLTKKSPEVLEALKNTREFVKNVTLEPRLQQGLDYLREMNLKRNMKNLGVYIKWVTEDILKEEMSSMEELGINPKNIGKDVALIAKTFYMNNLEA